MLVNCPHLALEASELGTGKRRNSALRQGGQWEAFWDGT